MTAHYRHAIWDWNGTLLNDTWLCVEVLNGLLTRRGRQPISEAVYRENFGFPVVHFYNYLGFETDVDSFERISREFIDAYEARWFQECALHSDAMDTLAELSRLGMSHSVLSAAKQEALDSGVRFYGLASHFMALVGTDNIHALGKIEQGQRWVKAQKWSRDEMVLIGDTLHDFEVAQALGIHCILMAHGHHTPERLAATGAPVVHSLGELLAELKSPET